MKTSEEGQDYAMAPEERSRLEALDGILRSEDVRGQVQPLVERVRAELRLS
ncbi:MAG: hypothetical protein M3R29_00625 [Verrucomicrobiota bacterium]|nr:hypothetical protein [Verrucomicrobiota bacterium]